MRKDEELAAKNKRIARLRLSEGERAVAERVTKKQRATAESAVGSLTYPGMRLAASLLLHLAHFSGKVPTRAPCGLIYPDCAPSRMKCAGVDKTPTKVVGVRESVLGTWCQKSVRVSYRLVKSGRVSLAGEGQRREGATSTTVGFDPVQGLLGSKDTHRP